MVFYFVLLGTAGERPPATASSSVFEHYRAPAQWRAPANSEDGRAGESTSSAAEGPVIADVDVEGVRLFRATGASLVPRRGGNLVEDALPMQRTSAVLLLAVPMAVSVRDLCAFVGDSLGDVEALRVIRRSGCEGDENRSSHAMFYSVVALCRTQAGADRLYEANHGRLFPSVSMGPPAGACGSSSDQTSSALGPCCYMVFLESVVYVKRGHVLDTLEPDVPAAAYDLPACPLCLERLDVSGTGMVTHNQGWLSAGIYPPASCCHACAAIARAGSSGAADTAAERMQTTSLTATRNRAQCKQCSHDESVWVCLICGNLGCGRYAAGHAKDHAFEERHKFCLDLSTGRIWDYSADVFVHRRLVQLAAATGSFEVALPAPATNAPASSGDRPKQARLGHDEEFAMELDAILASQLDHQRSLFEAQLTEASLHQDEAVKGVLERISQAHSKRQCLEHKTAEEGQRRKVLDKQLDTVMKTAAETEKQLGFVKELNHSLLANRREIENAKAEKAQKNQPTDGGDALVERLTRQVEELMAKISAAESGDAGTGSGTTAATPGGYPES